MTNSVVRYRFVQHATSMSRLAKAILKRTVWQHTRSYIWLGMCIPSQRRPFVALAKEWMVKIVSRAYRECKSTLERTVRRHQGLLKRGDKICCIRRTAPMSRCNSFDRPGTSSVSLQGSWLSNGTNPVGWVYHGDKYRARERLGLLNEKSDSERLIVE
ncbi:uncharacterized protein BDV14DRAFT_158424 [Aspergillus stella-maris]|uniref:uncharacterized protein n=1 Tax=Aspergillus stella-maris TaxID=1810926 RepID=UPI003CCD0304